MHALGPLGLDPGRDDAVPEEVGVLGGDLAGEQVGLLAGCGRLVVRQGWSGARGVEGDAEVQHATFDASRAPGRCGRRCGRVDALVLARWSFQTTRRAAAGEGVLEVGRPGTWTTRPVRTSGVGPVSVRARRVPGCTANAADPRRPDACGQPAPSSPAPELQHAGRPGGRVEGGRDLACAGRRGGRTCRAARSGAATGRCRACGVRGDGRGANHGLGRRRREKKKKGKEKAAATRTGEKCDAGTPRCCRTTPQEAPREGATGGPVAGCYRSVEVQSRVAASRDPARLIPRLGKKRPAAESDRAGCDSAPAGAVRWPTS